jgi:hypothetical protein
MADAALRAFLAERDAVLEVVSPLDAAGWAAPSACAGWSVRDVVTHMGTVAGGDVARAFARTRRAEDANEIAVRYWDDCGDATVMSRYRSRTDRFARLMRLVRATPAGNLPLPLGDLGTHPVRLLCEALVFDTYCHLRWDLTGPEGPVGAEPPPPSDAVCAATLDWMFAGLPPMCGRDVASALADADGQSVRLRVTGPGGGDRYLRAGAGGRVRVARHSAGEAVATIATSSTDFPIWATRRTAWRSSDVDLEGDTELAARCCDAIRII